MNQKQRLEAVRAAFTTLAVAPHETREDVERAWQAFHAYIEHAKGYQNHCRAVTEADKVIVAVRNKYISDRVEKWRRHIGAMVVLADQMLHTDPELHPLLELQFERLVGVMGGDTDAIEDWLAGVDAARAVQKPVQQVRETTRRLRGNQDIDADENRKAARRMYAELMKNPPEGWGRMGIYQHIADKLKVSVKTVQRYLKK